MDIYNEDFNLQKQVRLSKAEYEKRVASIPLNKAVNEDLLKRLKNVPPGEEALDIIIGVSYSKSRNDRVYTDECMRSIQKQILNSDVIIPMHYGHQNPATFAYEARAIVGSVVGAYLDDEEKMIYYRIIPDCGDGSRDIRRQIRNRQINAVSIWGLAQTETGEGGVDIVTDFELRSVDFVPPRCEGQRNEELVLGEAKRAGVQFEIEKEAGIQLNIEKKKEEEKVESVDYSKLDTEKMEAELLKRRRQAASSASKEETATRQGVALQKAEEGAELASLKEKMRRAGFASFDELFQFVTKQRESVEKARQEEAFKKLYHDEKRRAGLLDENGEVTGEMSVFVDRYAGCSFDDDAISIREKIEKVMGDEDLRRLISLSSESHLPLGEMAPLTGSTGTGELCEVYV